MAPRLLKQSAATTPHERRSHHRHGRLRRRRDRLRGRVVDDRGGNRRLSRDHDQELRLADSRRRVVLPRSHLDRRGHELRWNSRRRRRAQLGRLPQVRRRASGRRPHDRHLRSEIGRTVGGGSSHRRQAGRGARGPDHADREAGDRRRPREEHGRPRPARRLVRHRARRDPRRHGEEVRAQEPRRARGERARVRRGSRLRRGPPAENRARPAAARVERREEARRRRQRDVRGGGDLRRLRVLRRLSDHAVERDHAVPRPRDLEVRRHDAPGRGRDRRDRRRRRRVLRRQEGDDRDLRARHVAQDRDARPREHRRAAARLRQRAARRTVDGHSDQERAGRPLPGDLLRARRHDPPGARADRRRATRSQ